MNTFVTISQLTDLAERGEEVRISASDLKMLLEQVQSYQRPMSLKEAAAFYGKDPKTIVKYVKTKVLPGCKRGGNWEIYRA